MKNNEKSDLEKYLKETQTWETDKVQEIIKSRKTAWIIAICSFIVACMAVLAVAALTPLKTVQPFVIRVDNATGIVDVVESLKDGKANYDEVLTNILLNFTFDTVKDIQRILPPSITIMSA